MRRKFRDRRAQRADELGRFRPSQPRLRHRDVDAEHPALNQRYRGPVAGRVWQIAETHPSLTAEALTDALDLARHAAADKPTHKARDEAEAEAVVELARQDPNLCDMTVERKGRTVRCKSDICCHESRKTPSISNQTAPLPRTTAWTL